MHFLHLFVGRSIFQAIFPSAQRACATSCTLTSALKVCPATRSTEPRTRQATAPCALGGDDEDGTGESGKLLAVNHDSDNEYNNSFNNNNNNKCNSDSHSSNNSK